MLNIDPTDFWSHVDQRGKGCWPWLGRTDKLGQPRNYHNLRPARVAFILDRDRVADCSVRHRCRNKVCVRPSHLVDDQERDDYIVAHPGEFTIGTLCRAQDRVDARASVLAS